MFEVKAGCRRLNPAPLALYCLTTYPQDTSEDTELLFIFTSTVPKKKKTVLFFLQWETSGIESPSMVRTRLLPAYK